MTELTINNKKAILPSDLQFQLIFDNPYFTKSSTHTLEVELPMPSNIHIFGMLHRVDVTKQKITFPAVLTADGYQLLNGKALILGTDERTVKVQLMSGNAEFNFLNRDDLYINEVNWEAEDVFTVENGYYNSYVRTGDVLSGPAYLIDGDWTIHPDRSVISPEPVPFLYKLARVIIEHFGFRIGDSVLENSWLKHIICIGGSELTRNSAWAYKNKIKVWGLMPHWTVKEFFTYLEEFAGIVTYIDDKTRSAMMIDINDFFLQQSVSIVDTLDEYESDVSSEDEADANVTVGNTGYDLPSSTDDGYNRLDNKIIITAETKTADDYDTLYKKWSSDSEGVKLKTLYTANGRSYITKDGAFTEVDLYGNLLRNKDDKEVDNSLHFAPCVIKQEVVGLYKFNDRNLVKVADYTINVPVSYYNSAPIKNYILNIQEVIEGKTELQDKSDKDIMEVALCPGAKPFNIDSYKINLLSPYIDYTQKSPNQAEDNDIYSLSLHEVCEKSMGTRHRSLNQVKSEVTYKINFLLHEIPDIRKTFIIHSQKYFAKSIKVNITAKGFDKVMEGEFYKIEV